MVAAQLAVLLRDLIYIAKEIEIDNYRMQKSNSNKPINQSTNQIIHQSIN